MPKNFENAPAQLHHCLVDDNKQWITIDANCLYPQHQK